MFDVRANGEAWSFAVRVMPRASRERVLGLHGGALKVALTAPPVEGAANDALVTLIAKALGLPRGAVRIVRGEKSRDKLVEVTGADEAAIRALVAG